jgi:cytochrome c
MRLRSLCLALLLLSPAAAAAQQPAGDPAAGQRLTQQCRVCHTFEQGGPNRVGPNLFGVWERAAGSIANFRYSPTMRERAAAGLVWNEETLRNYIRDPKAVIPNGFMSFPGIRNNEQQITDILAYLRTNRPQ